MHRVVFAFIGKVTFTTLSTTLFIIPKHINERPAGERRSDLLWTSTE